MTTAKQLGRFAPGTTIRFTIDGPGFLVTNETEGTRVLVVNLDNGIIHRIGNGFLVYGEEG